MSQHRLLEGFNQLIIDDTLLNPIQIKTIEGGHHQLILQYKHNQAIELEVNVSQDSTLNIFITSESEEIQSVERYEVHNNAQLNLAFADLNNSKIKRVSSIHLIEEQARVDLHSAALVNQNHEVQYIFHHEAQQLV